MAEPVAEAETTGWEAPTRGFKLEGYWHRAWRLYRKSKAGLFGLAIVVVMGLVGLLAPVLANDQPLIAKYDGELYYPALKELTWTMPGVSKILPKIPLSSPS